MRVARAPSPDDGSPHVVVIREVADLEAAIVMLGAAIAVVVVLRIEGSDRQRVRDILTGWSLGAGGSLDWLGTNTVLTKPPNARPVRLCRDGITAAVELAHGAGVGEPLRRHDEERLRAEAAAGAAEARRRLFDAYAELAVLLAVWLRPSHPSQPQAVAIATEELQAIVAWHPSREPLLVDLVNRVHAGSTDDHICGHPHQLRTRTG